MKTLTPQIAAMYLGCRIIVDTGTYPAREATLTPTYIYDLTGIKLILRKLQDITNVEKNELPYVTNTHEDGAYILKDYILGGNKYFMKQDFKINIVLVTWLLQRSFDLFDGISEGWAIDSRTLGAPTKTEKL